MGNCYVKDSNGDSQVIGHGSFGKIWTVKHKKTKQMYALKELSKVKLVKLKCVGSVINEKQLLQTINSKECLYIVMELLMGGDLRYHLEKMKKFTEQQIQFFAACILCGLDDMHSKGILHRDIKPENLLLDKDGYIKICDLGIAKHWTPENAQDTSGTLGYMAPEVMFKTNHGVSIDYYALGITLYELMFGKKPFQVVSLEQLRSEVQAYQVQIKKQDLLPGWSLEAADFINRPINRLGHNGPDEVIKHPWFKGFPWDKLKEKILEAPYKPEIINDQFNTNNKYNLFDEDVSQKDLQLLRRDSIQNLFQNCNYTGIRSGVPMQVIQQQ